MWFPPESRAKADQRNRSFVQLAASVPPASKSTSSTEGGEEASETSHRQRCANSLSFACLQPASISADSIFDLNLTFRPPLGIAQAVAQASDGRSRCLTKEWESNSVATRRNVYVRQTSPVLHLLHLRVALKTIQPKNRKLQASV